MSHLVKDLIRASKQSKSVHLGPLTGAEFKLLMAELALVRKGAN
ncbi:hypothetical protein [Vibrio crassostreae]|nr:hypothetical protein [Vibrio crassostreae]TCT95235.1 hypothetical protein EDB47_1467 [Vibrio crassostreae]